jgi:von Willebrand factor type A domain
MRAKAGILLIMGLLLLVGTVAAVGIPDTVIVTTDKPWIVANNVDTSTITVTVTNTTSGYSGPVPNVTVNIAVDPLYGTRLPTQITTNSSGMAMSTFKVKTKSGAAQITATIPILLLTNSTIQNIDHDTPYFSYFSYPLSGTVATDVPFNVSTTDFWGNPIDNRRGNHTISLHVNGPSPDNCYFIGYGHDIPALILDSNGNQSVTVRLTTKIGPNCIRMDAFGNIPDRLVWINADTTGIPFSISQEFTPSGYPPSLPADGVSKFNIVYTLLDCFDNPTNAQWIQINTTVAGEVYQFKSNTLGQITATYGPRSSVGLINITATALGNASVTISKEVEFVNTAATNMELTANPETMASRDVNPVITADITASVMDIMGNPVENETVTFSLGTVRYPGGPYDVTSGPSLVSNTTTTDADGRATVTFIPGSFSTTNTTPATGNVTVTAHWGNISKNILATWKNYPYLSAKTSVNPQTAANNTTVEVTVEFIGDGYALQPPPVDVVLCTDRSGSMLFDTPDRMYSIREAAKVFVDQMNPSRDTVALVTFGRSGSISRPGVNSGIAISEIDNTYSAPKTYSDYATVDRTLIGGVSGFNAVKTSLNGIVPDHGTPMRSAIYKSVNEIKSRGRTGSNKSIVLLSDGDYNWYGDPLARGTGSSNSETSYGDLTTNYRTFSGLGSGRFSNQNMSIYAKNNNITIYSIAFADSISSGGKTTLETLALATGGQYFEASATDIEEVYTQIAGLISGPAGVDTTMVSDFQNVKVNNVSVAGADVYDYVPNATASTRIKWQDGITNVTDQSAEWAANHQLNFTIGTIKVGETWQAAFRLKVKMPGSIDVFGANSLVSFNGGTSTLTLPHTFLTVVPDLNATGMVQKKVTLLNPVTEPGKSGLLPITWNTLYTGNKTITEHVFWSRDNWTWIRFDKITHDGYSSDPVEKAYPEYAQLDTRNLPQGGYTIYFKIEATAYPDLGDKIFFDINKTSSQQIPYIQLE